MKDYLYIQKIQGVNLCRTITAKTFRGRGKKNIMDVIRKEMF